MCVQKGANWLIFNPPITASWSLKKICVVKDKVKDKLHIWMLKEKYQISEVYKDLLDLAARVRWDKVV